MKGLNIFAFSLFLDIFKLHGNNLIHLVLIFAGQDLKYAYSRADVIQVDILLFPLLNLVKRPLYPSGRYTFSLGFCMSQGFLFKPLSGEFLLGLVTSSCTHSGQAQTVQGSLDSPLDLSISLCIRTLCSLVV